MAKPTVIVDSRLHIPIKIVDAGKIIKRLTRHEFDDAVCRNCEFRPERPSGECRSCDKGGLIGVTALASYTTINDKKHVTIPYGEMHRFQSTTGLNPKKVKFKNLTNRTPFDYDVEFTASLRDYQVAPSKELLDELCGLLQAPPRSGKTVMGIAGGISTGYKTIIMADQKDFLDGFYETIEQMTNLPDLEEEHGKKLFGFPKKDQDYKDFQIILVTYQSLIQDTKVARKRMQMLNENFGTIFVDECFTRGHRVMTEQGLIDIADIVEGNAMPFSVLSKNLDTGEQEFRPIESRTKKTVRKMCRVTVGDKEIVCTPTHLFWSNTRGDYVEAQLLTEDDDLDLTKDFNSDLL
ncbi:DNA helicase [Yersinia phage fHe-Yen9-02]|nr:DNA helicase [Yersinia phage fHe-Yen9-02]